MTNRRKAWVCVLTCTEVHPAPSKAAVEHFTMNGGMVDVWNAATAHPLQYGTGGYTYTYDICPIYTVMCDAVVERRTMNTVKYRQHSRLSGIALTVLYCTV